MPRQVPAVGSRGRAQRRAWGSVLRSVLLSLVTLVFLLPLVYVLLVSLRSRLDVLTTPFGWPSEPRFENYRDVLPQLNYGRSIFNTVLITLASSLVVSVVAPLAAYPLARVSARWTRVIYGVFLAGLTIPFFLLMVPLYTIMRTLGLLNTYTGVVLLYSALNLPLGVFFYTSFLRSVPRELEEAAALDGCTPLGTFRFIVLPLLRPVTATLTMFVTLSVWNDFLLPLVFLNKPETRTIMVSVFSFVGQYGFDPTTLFPAAVLASLPLIVFFLILQRQIIAGISAGAVKG